MEGLFLTITLSIVVPFFILLLWFFVIFVVVKKCMRRKRQPSENGSGVPCRVVECATEGTAASTTYSDEPILNEEEQYSVIEQERSYFTSQALQLPLYSTLPRNSTRDSPRDNHGANSRHGYRLHPSNYSPFIQDSSLSRSETMQALSMYCDRYIADARYDAPPPYNSRENISVHSQLIRTVSGREVTSARSSLYGCETWIWVYFVCTNVDKSAGEIIGRRNNETGEQFLNSVYVL